MSIDGKPVSNAIALTALAILGALWELGVFVVVLAFRIAVWVLALAVPVAAIVYLYRVMWG